MNRRRPDLSGLQWLAVLTEEVERRRAVIAQAHAETPIALPDPLLAALLEAERAEHRARVAELEAGTIHLSEALRVARADAAAKAHRCGELEALIDDIKERIAGFIE